MSKSNNQNNSLNVGENTGCINYAPKQETHYHTKKLTTRVAPAQDTIGNNAEARNKMNLLVKKLGDYRIKRGMNASSVFPAINKDLAAHFGATSTPNISISRAEEVFAYLQEKIDLTQQGRINKGFRAKQEKK